MKNTEKKKASGRAFYAAHREREQARSRSYYAQHREARRAHDPARSRAYYAAHRDEVLARSATRYHAHPERQRAWVLQNKFGITPEKYNALYTAQEGKCAICGEHMEKPCVDHDHATGKARGLLCTPCNVILGMSHDNPEVLLSAIQYLTLYFVK